MSPGEADSIPIGEHLEMGDKSTGRRRGSAAEGTEL